MSNPLSSSDWKKWAPIGAAAIVIGIVFVGLTFFSGPLGDGQSASTAAHSTDVSEADGSIQAYSDRFLVIRGRMVELHKDLIQWENFGQPQNRRTFEPLYLEAQDIHQELQSMQPPPEAEEFHDEVLRLSSLMLEGLEHKLAYLDEGDMQDQNAYLQAIQTFLENRGHFFQGFDEMRESTGAPESG